jgi:hypothetical protein
LEGTHRGTPLNNVIDVHIARLRRKVDSDQATKLIHTVRGIGFMLRRRAMTALLAAERAFPADDFYVGAMVVVRRLRVVDFYFVSRNMRRSFSTTNCATILNGRWT